MYRLLLLLYDNILSTFERQNAVQQLFQTSTRLLLSTTTVKIYVSLIRNTPWSHGLRMWFKLKIFYHAFFNFLLIVNNCGSQINIIIYFQILNAFQIGLI